MKKMKKTTLGQRLENLEEEQWFTRLKIEAVIDLLERKKLVTKRQIGEKMMEIQTEVIERTK